MACKNVPSVQPFVDLLLIKLQFAWLCVFDTSSNLRLVYLPKHSLMYLVFGILNQLLTGLY